MNINDGIKSINFGTSTNGLDHLSSKNYFIFIFKKNHFIFIIYT